MRDVFNANGMEDLKLEVKLMLIKRKLKPLELFVSFYGREITKNLWFYYCIIEFLKKYFKILFL